MMAPDVKNMLSQEVQPENILKLKQHINKLLKASRQDMGKFYPHWDRNIRTYRGQMRVNQDDIDASQIGEPSRYVTPLSFAQIQTYVAFAFLLVTQNDPFYQIEPNDDPDFGMQEFIEKLLKRDCMANALPCRLYQFFLDIARCGIGIMNNYWTRETQWVQVPAPVENAQIEPYVTSQTPQLVNMELTKYEGNRIVNINPYNWLPDTRLPVTRWKEGQFVADEEEWHISQIKEWERMGIVTGSQFLRPMNRNEFDSRGPCRCGKLANSFNVTEKDPTDFMCVVGQVQIKLVPKDFGLGDSDYPVLHLVRLANDQRIISIEPAIYLHGDFTHNVSQMSPDNNQLLNESLADVIHAIQDVVTWLINSRIASVRKSLDSHFILDPSKFDMDTIRKRSPFMYIKKNMASIGIDKFFKQLEVRDTTMTHMQDADTLTKMMQFVTGVNDNAMGQFNGGRRSATEARAVNAGAASRMKIPVTMAWHDALGPMGRKMMINQRQAMTFDTFASVVGRSNPDLQALYQRYCPNDPRLLVGDQSIFVFDSTLQSEKGFMAQSLQDLLMAAMSNPETMQIFDIELLLEEIQTLRGVTNVKRFVNPQFRQPALGQVASGSPNGLGLSQPAVAANPGNPSGAVAVPAGSTAPQSDNPAGDPAPASNG